MASSGENYAAWIQPDEETLLDRFEEAWRDHPPAALDQFLGENVGATPVSASLLEELVKIDLEYRCRRWGSTFPAEPRPETPSLAPGDSNRSEDLANDASRLPLLEDYQAWLPQLDVSLDLIAEEYRVRCRWGDAPPHDEYERRFPRFAPLLPQRLSAIDQEVRSESTCDHSAMGTRHDLDQKESVQQAPAQQAPLQRESAQRGSDQRESVAEESVSEALGQREGDAPPERVELSFQGSPADSDMPTLRDFEPGPLGPPALARLPEAPRAEEPSLAVPDASPAPLPARLGRYEVVSLLGEGAFGAVYLATDPQLKRKVAIKTPHRRHLRNRRARKQFLEEARLAAQVRHPVLVAIHDIQASDDECFLVMEYIKGKPLSEFLRDDSSRRRDVRYAAQLVADVAEAVHEAHKIGLVHRDLKPANILLDTAGRPHVTDFGLALHEEDQRRRAWEVSGTPAYMAPEQVRGESHRLDGRCDVWSLGAILYELLTGRRAFGGRKVHDVFDEIVHREPKPPRQIDDAIPGDLERICLRCLAKDVLARYTTARDLADDLRRFLETEWFEAPLGDSSQMSRSPIPRGASVLSASTHHSSFAAMTSGLPQPPGAFVGRQREMAEVKHLLLDEKTPIITLLGPGGIGKTRLAQHVAQVLAQPLPGGAWWADLSAVSTASGVAAAVLGAFGAGAMEGEAPEERVASVLHYRPRLLLVLDNFEQVVEHAQATVGLWRRRAPHAQFLVTSREPLGLAGERHYELPPLAVPASDAEVESAAEAARFPSIELFVRRAQDADPRFALDASNAADVARICSQLEGLPLAVELAAARVKILKPAQMLKKFDQKLQFLKSSRRDLSDRQRTLEGAIQWSYDHLEQWERRAFLQVSAFVGGFFLEAAEAVIDLADDPDAPDAIDVVQRLREQCLLRTQDEKYELRLGMYQSIREFGEQKRRAVFSPEEEAALQQRLAEYLIGYCEAWSRRIHTADGPEALDRVAVETENLFAVQDWALRHDRPELAARAVLALAETLAMRGPADQRLPRLQQALACAPAPWRPRLLAELSYVCHASGDWDLAAQYADRAVAEDEQPSSVVGHTAEDAAERLAQSARALRQQGVMRRLRGDMPGALEAFRRAEDVARQAADRHGMAAALAQRGFVVWQQGEFEEALACYARAETLAREAGDRADLAVIARQRGHLRAQRGNYAEALADFQRTETLARELGDRRLLHLAISSRGMVLSDQGKYDEALECYDKAERLARRLGEKRGLAVNRGNRGLVHADRGDYERALACYAEAEAINRELGVNAGIALNIGNRGVALAGLGRHDEALACLREAERLHQQVGNRVQEAIHRGERGIVLLAQGQVAAAAQCLTEALATFDELNAGQTPDHFNFLTALASCHAQAGQHEQAARATAQAHRLAEALALTPEHPRLRIRENLELLRTLGAANPPHA